MAAYFRVVAVDGIKPDQGKIAFVVFWDAHASFDGVARMQVEAADLGGRDIDVVGAGKIGRVRAAEEAEAVGQDFKRAGAGETLAFFHHLADDGKYEVLFAESVGVFDAVFFRQF